MFFVLTQNASLFFIVSTHLIRFILFFVKNTKLSISIAAAANEPINPKVVVS